MSQCLPIDTVGWGQLWHFAQSLIVVFLFSAASWYAINLTVERKDGKILYIFVIVMAILFAGKEASLRGQVVDALESGCR